jgi:hypothetical protein
MTLIDTWYSQKTCDLLQSLMNTPDLAGGTLLGNTLVPYVTEVARADHTFNNAPFLVFGGAGVKAKRAACSRSTTPSARSTTSGSPPPKASTSRSPRSATSDMYKGALDIMSV